MIPDAKEPDAIQPVVRGQDETQPEELELDVIPPAVLVPGAIQLVKREQDETQPEELELNVIPPAVLVPGAILPVVQEQDETQPEELELNVIRCELLGVIPYGPGLRVAIPFSAGYAFLFVPVQQCGFPFVVPFSLQRGIRF